MTASFNHSSFEATAEPKINVLDKPSGENFPNPLMSVSDVYNCDAHPWSKNMILIGGESMINGINDKSLYTNFKSFKVRCFAGATINDM